MMAQRGRSRKQQAPHRALDADANYSASAGGATKTKPQIKRRKSKAGPSSPPSTPPSSPPSSPNTPVIDSTPPQHALEQHDSLTDADLGTAAFAPTSPGSPAQPGAANTAQQAAAAPTSEDDDDLAAAATATAAAAAAATATMLTALQQAARPAATAAAPAKKRKKPSGAGAAAAAAAAAAGGSSRQGSGKKGKGGPSLPLKPGLCSFCGETQSPMWRKGPEQYPRLCNRCGMRYSRNRNDLPKAFSAKVAARIQAERQQRGGSQASDLIGDMQEMDAGAFEDGGFESLPASPYSDAAAPAAAGMSAQQHTTFLLGSPAAAAAHSNSPGNTTLAGTDSGPMSEFEAAMAAAMAAAAAAAAAGDGRSRSSRARRFTEKAAALQGGGRQPRRSQGLQARMTPDNQVPRPARSALLDLVAQLSAEHRVSSIKEEPTEEDEEDTGPFPAGLYGPHGQHSDDAVSADEVEDAEMAEDAFGHGYGSGSGYGSRTIERRRGPSRLAMATYADAGLGATAAGSMGSRPMAAVAAASGGGGSGGGGMPWEALVAAASIDLEAAEAAAAASAAATAASAAAAAAVGTGLSQQQLSARRTQLAFQRAMDEANAAAQQAAAQHQQGRQAAWPPLDAFGPPALAAAAAPAQPAEVPHHEALSVDLLKQLLQQIAGQHQHQHQHPGRFAAAANPPPAGLPEQHGPVNYAPAAPMQQQQQQQQAQLPALQFLMHQTALQVVLQQPAAAGAHSPSQVANSMSALQGPSAPASAGPGPVNNPAPPRAAASGQLPPVLPLVRAAGMLDHPAMQQLMQQQVQSLLGMTTAAYGASAPGQDVGAGQN